MSSVWLPNYTQFTKIGKYQGHEVVLGDLSPLVTEIKYFPIANNKVKMPVNVGVKMLYDLFIKDIWGLTFFQKCTVRCVWILRSKTGSKVSIKE